MSPSLHEKSPSIPNANVSCNDQAGARSSSRHFARWNCACALWLAMIDVQLIAPLFERFNLWLEMQESRRSIEASCCLLGHVRQVMDALLEYGRAVRLAGQQLWVLKPPAIGGLPPFYLLIDYLFNHLKPHQVCPAAQPQLPLIRAMTRRKSPPTISETACLKTLDVASRAAHGASSVHQTRW